MNMHCYMTSFLKGNGYPWGLLKTPIHRSIDPQALQNNAKRLLKEEKVLKKFLSLGTY